MITGSALIVGALFVAWVAPVPLRAIGRGRDPGLAMFCWLATLWGVVATAVIGVGLLFGAGGLVEPWGACLVFLRHSHVHPLDEIVGGALLGVILIAAVRVAGSGKRRLRLQRRAYGAHVALLQAQPSPDGIVWLDHGQPFAYSIGGRPGLVVATKALRRLPARYANAVISHERHHLRGRHHLIIALVEILRDAVPRVPLFRTAPGSMRMLAELAADDAAAVSQGRAVVRDALIAMAWSTAEDLGFRLRHLIRSEPGRGVMAGVATRLAAGAVSVAVPPMVSAIGLGLLVTVACQWH